VNFATTNMSYVELLAVILKVADLWTIHAISAAQIIIFYKLSVLFLMVVVLPSSDSTTISRYSMIVADGRGLGGCMVIKIDLTIPSLIGSTDSDGLYSASATHQYTVWHNCQDNVWGCYRVHIYLLYKFVHRIIDIEQKTHGLEMPVLFTKCHRRCMKSLCHPEVQHLAFLVSYGLVFIQLV